MPRYGKVLTTNLSCSDSELWLGTLKLLGSGGFLFTETFKALWVGRHDRQQPAQNSLNKSPKDGGALAPPATVP